MKRITALTLTLVMLCTVFVCFVNAGSNYIIPNPPMTLELTSPTVDGDITDTEGWSDPCYMNADTLVYYYGNDRIRIWAEAYFALDNMGFYFSANILEGIAAYEPDSDSLSWTNSCCPLRGEPEDGKAFNADRFSLVIDPLCKLYDAGYMLWADYVPNYTVCIDENGKLHMQQDLNVITENVLVEGCFTDGGWSFEAFIPWSVITERIYRLTSESQYELEDGYRLSVDEIIANRASIKAGLRYEDMYEDEDGEYIIANKYFTAPMVTKDGKPGYHGKKEGIDTLGIDITVSNTCRTNGEHDWTEWIRVKNPTYTEKGKEISLCNICGTTTYREVDKLAVRFNFSDVRYGSWYYDSVLYCVKKGYMNGMSSTRFSPNTALTREQCVLILANIMEVNTETYKNTETRFTDVPTGKWYSGAVAWATEKGYVNGITKDRFGTGMNIQRVAFARLLYSVAQDLGMDMTPRADMSGYVDRKSIPDWAYEQISWAVANNIITSTKDDALVTSPYTQLTRAQCATMLWKLGLILDQ